MQVKIIEKILIEIVVCVNMWGYMKYDMRYNIKIYKIDM